jgi:hypothetical protein
MYYAPKKCKNPYRLPFPKRKRGRKSDLEKFLLKQRDFFPADLSAMKGRAS